MRERPAPRLWPFWFWMEDHGTPIVIVGAGLVVGFLVLVLVAPLGPTRQGAGSVQGVHIDENEHGPARIYAQVRLDDGDIAPVNVTNAVDCRPGDRIHVLSARVLLGRRYWATGRACARLDPPPPPGA